MKEVLKYLRMARPFVQLAGEELQEIDENQTGADDRAGVALSYASDVIDAIVKGRDIPYPPDALLQATEDVDSHPTQSLG